MLRGNYFPTEISAFLKKKKSYRLFWKDDKSASWPPLLLLCLNLHKYNIKTERIALKKTITPSAKPDSAELSCTTEIILVRRVKKDFFFPIC